MMKNMREQFSVPKRDDRFVADMLQHLAEKYHAPECASLKVKVVHCRTLEGWMELWPLARASTNPDTLSREYRRVPEMQSPTDWRNINALLFQAKAQNTTTGVTSFANEKQRRQKMIEHGFSPELANALSTFDAIIFTNADNIRQASRAGQPFSLQTVVTHECINLIERRTGQTIIKDFDAEHSYCDDQSAEALAELANKIGQKEFAHRYLETSQE
jgi:hypothetical protein